jgi:hypothetical protein
LQTIDFETVQGYSFYQITLAPAGDLQICPDYDLYTGSAADFLIKSRSPMEFARILRQFRRIYSSWFDLQGLFHLMSKGHIKADFLTSVFFFS